MSQLNKYILLSLICLSTSTGFSHNAGNDSFSLDMAVESANAGMSGDFTVDFVNPVLLESAGVPTQVRAVNSDGTFTFVGNDITVNGNGNILNGNNANVRGFFVGGDAGPATGSVTINDLIFQGCQVEGGAGGGGGMGAGGGLFVYTGKKVTLKDCVFQNCSAQGGSALIPVFSGGGGMKGNAGVGGDPVFGGGGGFAGDGDLGAGISGGGGGGCSDFPTGNASGVTGGNNFAGGSFPASGSGSDGSINIALDGTFGGGGGGGIGGGNGGFGGGGGACQSADAGNGGFGGGGGEAKLDFPGNGGFGGGSGKENFGFSANGGFGGGTGDLGLSGKGAGFGGAIFLMDGSELTIEGSIDFMGNSAIVAATGIANTDPLSGFGVLGQDVFMMSGSTIIFDITSEVLMQNPIQGNQGNEAPNGFVPTTSGGLTKKGPALLSLTGDNTYTGTTTVEEGELRIGSSVVTNVVVESGGTLSGNFDVKRDATGGNGGNLTNRGIVCPGIGGVGQINLEGDFTQESSGRLIVDITPTGNVNDRVFLNMGSATLAGTMEVIINEGNYIAGTTYEVINAPTNGTEFEAIVKTGGFGQLIDLQVDYSSVVITILNTVLFEGQNVAPGPATEVANAILDANIVPGSDFAFAVELLGTLDDEDLNDALVSLSAVRFGAMEWINARNNSYVADILSQHVLDLSCSPRNCDCCCCCDNYGCNVSGWVSVFGNMMNNRESIDFLRKYNADAVGVIVGMDTCCGPCFKYGGAFGYTRTDVLWRNDGGGGDLDSFYGALYGSWSVPCWVQGDFSLIGGGTCNHLNRNINYGTLDLERGIVPIDRTATSDYWGHFFTAHLGVRGSWGVLTRLAEPFFLVDYHYYTHDQFKESGAKSLNLRVFSKDQHFFRTEAGIVWCYEIDCETSCFSPYFGASWVGEFPVCESKQPASFKGQKPVINATSFDSNVHFGSPQAGFKWSHCNGASLSFGYKGLYNGDASINQLEGRFEWIF